jgi:hypothetical protein
MEWAGRFVVALMDDWPDHPYHYSPAVDPINVNRFPRDPTGDAASDRKRGRAVAHMCWQLAADEALVVEFDRHDGFWMLSNNGVFFNSMDYLYRPVSYTPSRARVDSDGKVRLILCHDDPGYHNWLDTQGFVRGNLTYRNLMTDAATVLDSRLVKRARLAEALPDDSVKITREERIAQLRARFDGIRRRYRL